MIALLTTLALASASDHDALDTVAWTEVATRRSAVGEVRVRRARVDGVLCVEGLARVAVSAERLLAVTDRMVTSSDWSSATLARSIELARDDGGFVLYQHFDAPSWTLSADRYWVIRGEPRALDDHTRRYRWHRVPASDWPEAQAASIALQPLAIEVPVNYGEWRFTEVAGGTELQYRACAELGGRAPAALVTWLTTQQVPDLVAELVVEADRS